MNSDPKDLKCPCCNNPWQAATGAMFAQICGTCEETKQAEEKDSSNLFDVDISINPAVDFYNYANKKWIDANPIPAGYPNWNTFLHLHVQSQERLKDLLQELNDSKDLKEMSADTQKLAYFYKAAMNEDKIEADGTKPLAPILDLCKEVAASVGDKSALAKGLGTLAHKYGVYSFFSFGASPDAKNSNHSIVQIAQSGLGLPDRDYYFDEDKEDKRTAYKNHVAKMLTLVQDSNAMEPTEECIVFAEKIYNLEEQIAKAHMTKTENRDPQATYNKMTIEEFETKICNGNFDASAYFTEATGKTVEELGDVNVRNLAALECVAELLSNVDKETLEQYLRWRSVRSCAKYLPKAFVMEDFDFNEKTLMGTNEIKPRWKRAMAFTESALGEALGQIYCEKYFDESCKEKILDIVESVRQALEDRLKEVDWMKSDSTRQEALKKMSRFNIKIGYPDEWIDYSTFVIEEEEPFLSMIIKSRYFDLMREVKEMNTPTDKKKWFMTPQTINAYYHPNLNEIVFPAAILQPPMFDPEGDVAMNYGAIGAVVGHEMTHGFDDKGRKYNFEGNMEDWWTPDDSDEYEKRVEVMVKQANAIEVHGQSLKGKLTCGENIADLGGLRLALRALKARPDYDENAVVGGFTPTQRFMLGWAKCWRQSITKERSLQLLTLDPHGPNNFRCNGPLSNMAEFHSAFNVTETDPLYKIQTSRVDIW